MFLPGSRRNLLLPRILLRGAQHKADGEQQKSTERAKFAAPSAVRLRAMRQRDLDRAVEL